MYKALTIAGSDSGGGAGIQADLKTFSALGVYGMSAITAITAQNTLGVYGVLELPTDLIAQQIDVVIADIGVDAAKTGMLSSSAIVATVVDRVRHHRIERLVVDPVMIAKSGDTLLQPEAVSAVRELLLPVAYVITPNLPEAETLVGRSLTTDAAIRDAAAELCGLGARHVVIKGGHRSGEESIDILFDGKNYTEYRSIRYNTPHTHGTGCTFSAGITAGLARGLDVLAAVAQAKEYISGAIAAAESIGGGHSPVNHFYRLWGSTRSAPPGS